MVVNERGDAWTNGLCTCLVVNVVPHLADSPQEEIQILDGSVDLRLH